MIIMNKFQKRVKKLNKNVDNCLVVGKGFGFLQEISEIYNTMFVIDNFRPELKLKNLVYREDSQDLVYMTDITAIFFDLETTNRLNEFMDLAFKWKSVIVIEGNDPIGRDLSGPLYKTGYQCKDLQGFFHIWTLT